MIKHIILTSNVNCKLFAGKLMFVVEPNEPVNIIHMELEANRSTLATRSTSYRISTNIIINN